eukprot:gene13182-17529_t
MLATGIAIKLDSKGPVLFRQKRYGFNNEVINVLKFRSMYTEMSDPTARNAVTKNDPRVTPVGRFIRKTSIDELPQIFNVLRGDLSLVGPRPHAVFAQTRDKLYGEVVEGYFARHRVKPGVTGWAQINGWRGEVDTDEKIKFRTAFDLYYIENWSLLFDLKILFLTPIRLMNTENAAALALMASWLVAFSVFLSGFVMSEPAPYELLLVGQVAIWFLLGLKISRAVAPLLALLLTFNVGGMLSLTQMNEIGDAPVYLAVTFFLRITSVFYC